MSSAESFTHGIEPRGEATELEIPEVDMALLREILEELDRDDIAIGSSCSSMEYVVQPQEVHHPGPVSEAPSTEQDRVPVQVPGWLEDVMPPSEEMKMGWYGDEMVGTTEFHYVVDDGNLAFYDGIAHEETGYDCLWENS